jgi:hypothetical protein
MADLAEAAVRVLLALVLLDAGALVADLTIGALFVEPTVLDTLAVVADWEGLRTIPVIRAFGRHTDKVFADLVSGAVRAVRTARDALPVETFVVGLTVDGLLTARAILAKPVDAPFALGAVGVAGALAALADTPPIGADGVAAAVIVVLA